ncbi:stevor, partial [Plasmodium gaboni]
NKMSSKKEIYNNAQGGNSNMSPRRLRYLEIQRNLYNDIDGKQELYFRKLSDKSNNKNDKPYEYPNKKNLFTSPSSLNKIKDTYLDNLKNGCVGSAATCAVSSIITGSCGIAATPLAAAPTPLAAAAATPLAAAAASYSAAAAKIAAAFGASLGTFSPYGIAALVLIIIALVLIILYIWLYRRRKTSWKHECKNHLCT